MPYHVHVSQFDGPLDLLLHLIESAELDIKDIFISEITTQYLAYMHQLDGLDMDTASEFLAMAATLLYIKSRQLLPRPPVEANLEEEDPEVALIRQLHAYKVFKMAGEALHELQDVTKGVYTRLPEELVPQDQKVLLSDATMDMLFQAFFAMLHAQPEAPRIHPLHQVKQDEFTVRAQITKIRAGLALRSSMRFEDLFSKDAAQIEMVVTFMALLEMLARGEVHLYQSAPFAAIRIKAKALNLDDADMDYMDEGVE